MNCILFIVHVHKICEMRKYLKKQAKRLYTRYPIVARAKVSCIQAKREFYFVHLPITDTNAKLQHGY